MSRESDLRINFQTDAEERELVRQICDYLKESYSIDEISCDDSGISINVWNSEHYYLADVMPVIIRIIATVFSDRKIEAEGTGTYSVVDDIHEYSASFNPESNLIFCSWLNCCRGLNVDNGTKYCALGAGLPASETKKIKEYSHNKGYTQLAEIIDERSSVPALQTSLSKVTWHRYDDDALVAFLRSKKNLHIPNELDKVYGFEDCSRIETVTFGNAVKSICDNAFRNCKSLREATIPNTIEYLGDGAFANCGALERVEIACDLDTLPPKLLLNCESLKELIITGKVKNIAKTFQGLHKLETVVLPEGLEKLGAEAFADCTSLEEISLPSTLKTVADNAFNGCKKLNLEIPAGVQTVSPIEVQDDLLIKAITCIQNEKEAADFLSFLGKTTSGNGLNSFKNYKKLITKYEAEPWYIEYCRKVELARTSGASWLEQDEIRKQFFKMTFNEYAQPFYRMFIEANDYEQAKKLAKEFFAEAEIQKINTLLTGFFMLESGYKAKEVSSTLGISNSLLSKINLHVQYGDEEITVMKRLKEIC